jgi:hypothetical protein
VSSLARPASSADNVKLYQGVTLGAKSFPLDKTATPSRASLATLSSSDDVIIYANATILGRITIGSGCVVGANVWVTRDMKPNSRKYKQEKIDIDRFGIQQWNRNLNSLPRPSWVWSPSWLRSSPSWVPTTCRLAAAWYRSPETRK